MKYKLILISFIFFGIIFSATNSLGDYYCTVTNCFWNCKTCTACGSVCVCSGTSCSTVGGCKSSPPTCSYKSCSGSYNPCGTCGCTYYPSSSCPSNVCTGSCTNCGSGTSCTNICTVHNNACSGSGCGSNSNCASNQYCSGGACTSGACNSSTVCTGTCGTGPNSCLWTNYGCSAGSCVSNNNDADTQQSYCDGCKGAGYWNISGEVNATVCCGDDNSEYKITKVGGTDAPTGYTTDAADDACCNVNGKCVASSVCTASGSTSGSIPTKAYCNSGTWEGGDTGSAQCSAIGGTWMTNVPSGATCCGDDSTSDTFENGGSGNSACFEGTTIAHGSISSNSKYMTVNGQLFYCGVNDTDTSSYGFVDNLVPGDRVLGCVCAASGNFDCSGIIQIKSMGRGKFGICK